MLGLSGFFDRWQWAAYGKHPMAKDYFSLGNDLPLSKTFPVWLQKGYGSLPSSRMDAPSHYSWRFWSRGAKKDSLVCGLVRDSSDGIGRPYPLVLLGNGPLRGFEEHWDLLVSACEKTWSRMEYLSKRRYNNVKDFENDLILIPSPEGSWEKFAQEEEERRRSSPEGNVPLDEATFRKAHTGSGDRDSLFIDLQRLPVPDQSQSVSACHSFLKKQLKSVPNAVFMGGAPRSIFLAVYLRALSSEDFVRLWSV
jgi:type VI secretion system protein VasJ